MYQLINQNNNSDEWILLINDDSSQSINIDAYSTTSTRTSTNSDKSFNTDDALALNILGDNYDFEAQRPFVLAYPIEDNKCCYDSSTIKSISNCAFKQDITGYVFICGVWIFMGALLYLLTRL